MIRQAVWRASVADLTRKQKLRLRVGDALLVLCGAGVVMLTWLNARKDPEKQPQPFWVAVILALSLGVFLAYVVPWVNRLCPSKIRVRKHGIFREMGSSFTFWKYRDISGCRISPFQTDAGEASVLAITNHKGQSMYIGIPESVPLEELRQVLSERGVAVMES